MNFFKKSLIFITIILLFASIYHDMTSGSISTEKDNNVKTQSDLNNNTVHVQVLPGQTVLSIVEKHNNSKALDVAEIIKDFKKLNPNTEPYHLDAYKYYYFPVYSKKGG
ncbi:hypothetical protein LG329_02635 [Virgibacillus necropolis]|uniref:hypothetical protein n=1 Tax=Virgibacillus necropolis TaxID=163877 RepID=UPI00384B498A